MIRYKARVQLSAHRMLIPQIDGKMALQLFFTLKLEDFNTMKAKTSDILKIQLKIEQKKKDHDE